MLNRLNRRHAKMHPGEQDLETRIASFELAAAMQTAAKEAKLFGNVSTAASSEDRNCCYIPKTFNYINWHSVRITAVRTNNNCSTTVNHGLLELFAPNVAGSIHDVVAVTDYSN